MAHAVRRYRKKTPDQEDFAMNGTRKRNFKWIVDLCMTLVLLCLMA